VKKNILGEFGRAGFTLVKEGEAPPLPSSITLRLYRKAKEEESI
jgi:hypothetical protein